MGMRGSYQKRAQCVSMLPKEGGVYELGNLGPFRNVWRCCETTSPPGKPRPEIMFIATLCIIFSRCPPRSKQSAHCGQAQCFPFVIDLLPQRPYITSSCILLITRILAQDTQGISRTPSRASSSAASGLRDPSLRDPSLATVKVEAMDAALENFAAASPLPNPTPARKEKETPTLTEKELIKGK